jgi:cell division ATPase FtsA
MSGIVEVAEDVFGLPARLAEEASTAGTAAIGDASATVLGLLDYASRCGAHAASRGPTWHGAVQRLRQVFGAGGARRDVGACSPARAVFEAAAHEGGHVPQRVGVDLEVGDVRV